MTLSNAAAARIRLIVWCKARGHQVEPRSRWWPLDMVRTHGFRIGSSGLSVPGAAAGKWIWSSPVPAIPDGCRHREADRVPFPKSIRPIDKSYGPTGLSLLAR